MAVITIPQVIEDRLGKEASAALASLLRDAFEEEKRDVLTRIDEKVIGRYADIQRRIHEDIAGVELRLDKRMSDFELRFTQELSRAKESMLRWFIAIFVLQGGFTLFMVWASRHLLA